MWKSLWSSSWLLSLSMWLIIIVIIIVIIMLRNAGICHCDDHCDNHIANHRYMPLWWSLWSSYCKPHVSAIVIIIVIIILQITGIYHYVSIVIIILRNAGICHRNGVQRSNQGGGRERERAAQWLEVEKHYINEKTQKYKNTKEKRNNAKWQKEKMWVELLMTRGTYFSLRTIGRRIFLKIKIFL